MKWPWTGWLAQIRERQTHHFNELWAKMQHSEEAAQKRHAEVMAKIDALGATRIPTMTTGTVGWQPTPVTHMFFDAEKSAKNLKAAKKRKGARRKK